MGETGGMFLPAYGLADRWAELRYATDWVTGGHGSCNAAGCYNPFEDAAGLKEGFYVD